MGNRSVLAAGACLALLSCAAHSAEKNLDRTFTVAPGGTLRVGADSSDIVVTGSDADQVVVKIHAKGSESSIDRLELSAEQTSDGVEVTARHRSKGWMGWLWQTWRLDSRVTVQVPRRYNIDLKTSGGDITINGVEGTASGRTSGGDVSARHIDGPLDLATSGGDVEVESINGDTGLRTSGGDVIAATIHGKLNAKTSGGDIRLTRIEGEIQARTSSGDVTASDVQGSTELHSSGGNIRAAGIDGSIRVQTSGGDITAELVGANRGISASSSAGTIELRLPKNVAGQLDASTTGGHVTTDIPVTTTVTREGKLQGAVNGGGEAIQVRTSGGDIRLRAKS